MRPALQVRGLRKAYRLGMRGRTSAVDALAGIDLAAGREEIIGIAGPAGAGKSTLMLCVAGLLRPDYGSITWFGEMLSAHHIPPGIAYVPRRAGFYSFLTVCEALEYHATLHELASSGRAAQVDAAMREASLLAHASRRVSQLSPALHQRLGLAQALIGEPRAVLLDETLSGEGLLGAPDVIEALGRLSRRGVTVLLSAPDARELADVATRTVVLSAGRIIESASPSSGARPQLNFRWPDKAAQHVAEATVQ